MLSGADERRLGNEPDDLGADDRDPESLGLGANRLEDALATDTMF